ncbi:MAG: ATP-grasp domain-containing protein [Alphaproteobacteria bacterium]|nr:ATP-grasp domain-containing protein [Alphaproteobacteria bacterium]MCB9792087.1 ATP-grasp domain-containing protein [Alphaproteobacteria bacterium]
MHVLFVAPHFPPNQRRFVAGLKAVGARVTGICDGHPDHQVAAMLDDVEMVSNVTDVDALTEAVRRVQKRGPWVHHLEATVEAHVLAAAVARERTGIPGLPSAAAELCRDKFKMKEHLLAQGFPCARQAAVSTGDEARQAVAHVRFPFVIKPRDGAGAAGTYACHDPRELEQAIAELGLDHRRRPFTMEQFLVGHEGFYDTLTIGGQVAFEAISHYSPNVLEAMRSRQPAYIAVTNRMDAPGYGELKAMGRRVVQAMGITTSATHMEWFFGPEGLKFSEIGARPPGVHLWDIYCEANDFDLYTEWARAVCWGTLDRQPSRRFAGGLLSIRPDRDGVVRGYSGVDEIQRRYGQWIFKAHLPPVGSRTQPVEAGYRANAYLYVKHPDYDGCREMMDDIGRTLLMHAH